MGDSGGRWTELMSSLFTTSGNKEAILEYLHNNAEKQAEYHAGEAKYWRGMAEITGALKGKCVEGTVASGGEAESGGASDAKLSELVIGLNKVLSIVETNKSLIAETKADMQESAKMTQEQMKTMSEATAAAAASNAAAAQASAAASVIASASTSSSTPAPAAAPTPAPASAPAPASPPPPAKAAEPPAPVKKEEPPAPKPEPVKKDPPKPASPPKASPPKEVAPVKKEAPPPAQEPEPEKPKKKMSAFERARMKAKQAEEKAAKEAAEKPKPRYGGSRKKFGGKKLTNTKMFEGIVPGGGAPGMSSAGAAVKNVRKASNPEPPKPKAADPPPPAAPASDEKTAVAMYDLDQAANDEALTFKTGDKATIVSMDGEWWLVNLNGKQGYVPHNFFKLEEAAAKAEPPPPAAPPAEEEAAPPPPAAAAHGGPPGCVEAIALYPYTPAPGGDHSVTMEEGDIVYLDPSVVGLDDPNEWRYVHKGDDKGYVPKAYIKVK